MSPFIVALIAFIFLLIFRILNVASQPQKPRLFFKDEKFASRVVEMSDLNSPWVLFLVFGCYDLKLEVSSLFLDFSRYIPTRVWGFSGHIQTVLHSLIGRMKCPWPIGERTSVQLSDGATLTYDMYQPLDLHTSGGTLNSAKFYLIIFLIILWFCFD